MKRISIILWCCFCAFTSWAQALDENELSSTALDRVRAQRVAFITEKIDMTSKEAEKFWPLFNEYEKEDRKIRQAYRADQKRIIDMSDEEARQFIVNRLDMEQKLLDLKRQYYLQLAEIVSPRKLASFNRADREFKKMLLNRLRERRKNGGRG